MSVARIVGGAVWPPSTRLRRTWRLRRILTALVIRTTINGSSSGTGTNVQHELALRVVLQKPPAGIDYGVQVGRGAVFETAQRQRSAGKDLRFEFTESTVVITTFPASAE
jgi:Family of unknown function (DUF5990)